MLHNQSLPGVGDPPSAGSAQGRTHQNSLLACDLTALTADERLPHQDTTAQLFGDALQEIQELPQSYAFRFTADAYPAIAAFVAQERRCCPFLTFGVEVSAEAGPIWLRMTGPAGVKALLQAEFPINRFVGEPPGSPPPATSRAVVS